MSTEMFLTFVDVLTLFHETMLLQEEEEEEEQEEEEEWRIYV